MEVSFLVLSWNCRINIIKAAKATTKNSPSVIIPIISGPSFADLDMILSFSISMVFMISNTIDFVPGFQKIQLVDMAWWKLAIAM
ncbi:hypothetical protein CRYUN_Cryun37aG0011100 [Craigia yunnanensis]